MDRETAEFLMQVANALGEDINRLATRIESLADAELQKSLKYSVVDLTMCVYEKVMKPAIKEFPDLDPDREFLSR